MDLLSAPLSDSDLDIQEALLHPNLNPAPAPAPLLNSQPPLTHPTFQKPELASPIDSALDRVLVGVEQLLAKQELANEKRETRILERVGRVKREVRDLKDWMDDMLKEESTRWVEEIKPEEEPVVLVDAVGRKFVFPFEKVRVWERFANLVRQAFIHVDFASHHVNAGYFDILSPKGHVILPAVWSEVIEPGWELSMHMWPMPEPVVPVSPHPPPPPPPFSPPPHPRRSRRGVDDERYVRVFEDDASSCVSENDTCIPERDYVLSGPLSEISEEDSEGMKESALSRSLSQKIDTGREPNAPGTASGDDATALDKSGVDEEVYGEWDALEDE